MGSGLPSCSLASLLKAGLSISRPSHAANVRFLHKSAPCSSIFNRPVTEESGSVLTNNPHFGRQLRGLTRNKGTREGRGPRRRKHVNWNDGELKFEEFIKPVPEKVVASFSLADSVGSELVGPLKKDELLRLLNKFYQSEDVKVLASEKGLEGKVFLDSVIAFRRYCIDSEALPTDLHIVLSDILQGTGSEVALLPYFLRHAAKVYPHLECLGELQKISDLKKPANWYSEARGLVRKVVFHAGPTNSGKTHHAFQRFLTAKSGVYCGPLKMLAAEIYGRSNKAGVPCDMVTGEERRLADPEGEVSAPHVACTVEMAMLNHHYEVAIIDEIQLLKDLSRGWAWTRALLGICADEVHVCGEAASIDLVQELLMDTMDEIEIRRYKRLTPLAYETEALGSLENIQPGDCLVCFSKNDIYASSQKLEKLGVKTAVIYGGLPPACKLEMAEKFNDPNDPCNVLIATDAIGMGLNLNIRRIVFSSLLKPTENAKGEVEMEPLSTSQALQISGRAGRHRSAFAEGLVTTVHAKDLPLLMDIIAAPIDPPSQAGLHPTADQIELFAYHLPHASFSDLIDIFISLSTLDGDKYFLCHTENMKYIANLLEHMAMPLRAKYVFCCAPISKSSVFVGTMIMKMASQYANGEVMSCDWLAHRIGWPLSSPRTLTQLTHYEAVFDVLDLYLWLSYRFSDMFPDRDQVRFLQKEVDTRILEAVKKISEIIQATSLEKEALKTRNQKKAPQDMPRTSIETLKHSPRKSGNRGRKHGSERHGIQQQLMLKGLINKNFASDVAKNWPKKKP